MCSTLRYFRCRRAQEGFDLDLCSVCFDVGLGYVFGGERKVMKKGFKTSVKKDDAKSSLAGRRKEIK